MASLLFSTDEIQNLHLQRKIDHFRFDEDISVFLLARESTPPNDSGVPPPSGTGGPEQKAMTPPNDSGVPPPVFVFASQHTAHRVISISTRHTACVVSWCVALVHSVVCSARKRMNAIYVPSIVTIYISISWWCARSAAALNAPMPPAPNARSTAGARSPSHKCPLMVQ